jgi:Ca-activated chloride channel family protein
MLDETGSDSIPRGGSDLASFQKEVLNGFAGIDAGSRLLILVSDGEDHGGTAETAARRLRESGLLICSVTAGSDTGSVIPLPGGNFLKNRDGEIVRSQANPAALEWFTPRNVRLDPGGNALVTLYDQVRPLLQKRSIKISRQRQVERFQFPLAAALLLLVLEPFFKGRRHS